MHNYKVNFVFVLGFHCITVCSLLTIFLHCIQGFEIYSLFYLIDICVFPKWGEIIVMPRVLVVYRGWVCADGRISNFTWVRGESLIRGQCFKWEEDWYSWDVMMFIEVETYMIFGYFFFDCYSHILAIFCLKYKRKVLFGFNKLDSNNKKWHGCEWIS